MAMTFKRVQIDGDALVVTFDMCSSSTVLDQLTVSGRFHDYEALIGEIKRHLATAQDVALFDPYKFMGDGWILLFLPHANGSAVVNVLRGLCHFYAAAYAEYIHPNLDTHPSISGLTFGIEHGLIRRTTIFQQDEYVGRTLNVAARLQSAVKDVAADMKQSPASKGLVSDAAFRRYFAAVDGIDPRPVEVSLRNIDDGSPFVCQMIDFTHVE